MPWNQLIAWDVDFISEIVHTTFLLKKCSKWLRGMPCHENISCIIGPYRGEFNGHSWIYLVKILLYRISLYKRMFIFLAGKGPQLILSWWRRYVLISIQMKGRFPGISLVTILLSSTNLSPKHPRIFNFFTQFQRMRLRAQGLWACLTYWKLLGHESY